MVSVPHIIEELKHALENVVAEESLLEIIENHLKTLREIYPSNKHQFTPEYVSFLRNLNENICRQLRSFIELKEELANVESLEEYTSLEKRLISIKSEYPLHTETKTLTPKQKEYLR